MTTVTLNVPDIHCGHCKSSIEGAVADVPGVERVEVTIDTRTVEIDHDESTQMDAIVGAIEGQGYEVETG
jgi:copper chaperone